LEAKKLQIVAETLQFQNGLIQIALAFNYFEPVRAAMELSQCIIQAIPAGGLSLLQLPGVDIALVQNLRIATRPIKTIQDLLRLDDADKRKALATLNQKTYSQAINIAKQIPILVLSNIHFKGTVLLHV
jgi:preprotein translocase subunit Sec63